MKTIQVDIVTPERTIFEGNADIVIATGFEGELGIMAGHAPLVTPLKISAVRLKDGNNEQKIAISGGFLEVRPEKVTILAETAELQEEIDVDRAKKAQERAEKQLQQLKKEELEYRLHERALERALNRLKISSR